MASAAVALGRALLLRRAPSPGPGRAGFGPRPRATPVPGGPGRRTFAAGGAGAGAAAPGGAERRSVDPAEEAKFARIAAEWWEPAGPFAALHAMNPVRCGFIRTALCGSLGLDAAAPRPLEGVAVLDLGCGGGLLSEPLGRLGARVLGIDASVRNVEVARQHLRRDPDLAGRVEYEAVTAETLLAAGRRFDAVVCSEVIEHVVDPPEFCRVIGGLTRKGGAAVLSTMNRTPASYAAAIVAAEYVLQLVPAGTHEWNKFVTPEELAMMMEDAGFGAMDLLAGMLYNPATGRWKAIEGTAVNYIASFTKGGEQEDAGA